MKVITARGVILQFDRVTAESVAVEVLAAVEACNAELRRLPGSPQLLVTGT